MHIYQPAEDSYLLQETLRDFLKTKNKEIMILDMGSGSGIQAQTAKKLKFINITTTDINKEAVELLKKQKLTAIKSNLFERFV